jgi:glycosyltransferase involved in cell wall biosynthesis
MARQEAKHGVLFVYRRMVPFVKSDFEALKRHFPVFTLHVTRNIAKDSIDFALSTAKSDVIFVWFAGFQALLSVLFGKLFRKRVVVVAGGYDAAYVPEIGYGAFTCWYRAAVAYFVLKHADTIAAVSENTKKEIIKRLTPKSIVVIYNGIDTSLFTPNGQKEPIVLTVAAINNSNLKKKGLKTFVEAAAEVSEARFVLAGRYSEAISELKQIAGANVEFTGYISFKKLLSLYQQSAVYAQLSYHESFGVALAEAMACECVPVTTKRAALPEVVGDSGIYVPYGDVETTAKAVAKALNETVLGKRARRRVVERFSMQEREKKLVETINLMLFDQKVLATKKGE